MSDKPSILFVCLGNICRSPMAEGAMRRAAEEAGIDLKIDSAGTAAYHVGDPPDPRAIEEAAKHGVDIQGQRGRQLDRADFTRFDHIFAMDENNLIDIRNTAPADATAKIALLMDAVPGKAGREVADPYQGGTDHFEEVWHQVDAAAKALAAVFIDEQKG